MAHLVGVIFTSHAVWVDLKPSEWDAIRAKRHHRQDVPTESANTKSDKAQRSKAAKDVLRSKLDQMRPDVLLIFGDDQTECFDFANCPSLAIYTGDEFAGRDRSSPDIPNDPAHHVKVPGHPRLATSILTGLLERDFDPAFCMSPPNPARGMCHAVMTPLAFFARHSTPTVPVLINAYYAPQMSARRCFQVGKAVREIIDEDQSDLRIVAIGSGGLWHTPNREGAYLDEDFDQRGLDYLRSGDISGWSDFFDSYVVPSGDASQEIVSGRGITGLPGRGGPQMGTRETCNWIGAAGLVDGHPSIVVDYVPVYASPIGLGFAYCDQL